MSLRLRDVTNDDLPRIERWLRADHVRTAWGDPGANLRLLSAPPAEGGGRAIIEADGRKVGIVMWQHPTREELDVAGLADIPTSAIDIDIMIGELDALGRGLGPAAIGLVAETVLSDPEVPFVIACARLDNVASQRAFAKAGFRRDREFDDVPDGLHVLLVRHRPTGRPAAGRAAAADRAHRRARRNRMPGPARTGVLIYAKHLETVSTFYERVLDAKVLRADAEVRVLEAPDVQLVIHAIPPQFALTIDIDVPPEPRDQQAIKPFFTVERLAEAERVAEECGGIVYGPVWPGPGFTARNVCDPEGNIVHLRERTE